MDLTEVIEATKDRLEKVGIYVQTATVSVNAQEDQDDEDESPDDDDSPRTISDILEDPNLKQKMIDGNVSVAFYADCVVNDVAFSDRIQNPKDYELDVQFQEIVPTEKEVVADSLREKLKNLKPGDDILSLLDDED